MCKAWRIGTVVTVPPTKSHACLRPDDVKYLSPLLLMPLSTS